MATASTAYGAEFFAQQTPSSEQAARGMLPLVMELLEPVSIVDVGCGSGAWLAQAAELGIHDYLGVDGHTPASALRIEAERFMSHDLTTALRLERRFDLVVCLEVAEHLPRGAADILVESLVRLGPAVLFSAAVPHQSGERHLNEQWPDYWVERFSAHDFVAVDAIRPRIWSDPSVAWWYRQNTLLFCEEQLVAREQGLRDARDATRDRQLTVVHPDLYGWMTHQRDVLAEEVARFPSLREVLAMLPRASRNSLMRRLLRKS
jgi:SAM-dependent methyltransferase